MVKRLCMHATLFKRTAQRVLHLCASLLLCLRHVRDERIIMLLSLLFFIKFLIEIGSTLKINH